MAYKDKYYLKKYYIKNKKRILEYSKKWRKNNTERTREIARNFYHRNKEQCLECQKKWRKKNKKYVADYRKKWEKENRARIRKCKREWYQKNKEKILQREKIYRKDKKFKQHNNNYIKERRKNPRVYLDVIISNHIRTALKGNKAGRSWETLVGYTLQDLTQHLEKQFDDKMSWQNYGSYWHIDHIVPKSWFPYQIAEEQAFKDCWALANLQPLEAKENLIKGNKIVAKRGRKKTCI